MKKNLQLNFLFVSAGNPVISPTGFFFIIATLEIKWKILLWMFSEISPGVLRRISSENPSRVPEKFTEGLVEISPASLYAISAGISA